MRNIEIAYDWITEKHLNSGRVPRPLQTIVSIPYCLQNMCIGEGMNWDQACPKYLRGTLDKAIMVKAFTVAKRLHATVSIGIMDTAAVTLRFFMGARTERSFFEITVHLNNNGKSMSGDIRTLQQLTEFAFRK